MSSRNAFISSAVLLTALTVTACSFGPPPSCGEGIGGTADQEQFATHFEEMSLVSQTTGEPGTEGDQGAQFAQGDPLAIVAAARSEVTVRACVQPLSGGGEIALDATQTLAEGTGEISLGTFEPGTYVVRVIVDGTLVKNFPFVVE